MNQPKRILVVEIKMLDETDFDPSQIKSMTVYQDSGNNYHLATGLKHLEQAIIEAIIHPGSNYRHPLLFDVQIVPGDEINISDTLLNNQTISVRRRRAKKIRSY